MTGSLLQAKKLSDDFHPKWRGLCSQKASKKSLIFSFVAIPRSINRLGKRETGEIRGESLLFVALQDVQG